MDTFDPKPMLNKHHGQPMPTPNLRTERKTGNLLRSPFTFKKYGQSGIEVSEIFPKVGECIDDICVIRSMHTDRPNHEPSLFMMNCGDKLPGGPPWAPGSPTGWEPRTRICPALSCCVPGCPSLGRSSGLPLFCPAVYQGTYLPNNEKEPEKLIHHIRNQELALPEQKRQLDLLGD